MILLIGILADPVTAYLCSRLSAREIDFLLVDPRQYGREFHLSWTITSDGVEGEISYGERKVRLGDIHSLFARQMNRVMAAETVNGSEHALARHEAYCSLVAFADTWPGLVINRPSACSTNGSKPYQQQVIARHGFHVPGTLVTTVPEEARLFYEESRGRVIFKSVSHQRSIVRRMSSADLERLDAVRDCPTQFQEYVPGVDIRVHTVGRRVFATEISTEATDYRFAAREGATREMRGVQLPDEITARCLRLAEELGLPLSGIDLRRSPDGRYTCFEVNPAPVFTFYQAQTGQRIGDALVQLLDRGVT